MAKRIDPAVLEVITGILYPPPFDQLLFTTCRQTNCWRSRSPITFSHC
jgi:hypothetical protein